MTPDEFLDAVDAAAQAATPGPWYWKNTNRQVHLFGARSWVVMAFKRLGMRDAQPMFRGRDNLLYDTADADINDFADAAFIARARTDVPALSAAVRAVLAIHQRSDDGVCVVCWTEWAEGEEWPCPTVAAIAAHLSTSSIRDVDPPHVEHPRRDDPTTEG